MKSVKQMDLNLFWAITLTIQSLLLINPVNCQVYLIGNCPDPPAQKYFDISRFTGRWYEIEKFLSILQLNTRCVTTDYFLHKNGSIKIINTGADEVFGHLREIDASATIPDPKDAAKFHTNVNLGLDVPFLNHRVLLTDYKTYAAVWACTDLLVSRLEYAWILSRKNSLASDVLYDIHENLKKMGINPIHFRKTNQRRCSTK